MMLLPYVFFLLGIGVLVPWNVFISLKSYYETRFCSDANTSMAGHGGSIESGFATVYNLSSIITMILLIAVRLLGDRWRLPQFFKTNGYDSIVPTDNTTSSIIRTPARSHPLPLSLSAEAMSCRMLSVVEFSPEFDMDDANVDNQHRQHRPFSSFDTTGITCTVTQKTSDDVDTAMNISMVNDGNKTPSIGNNQWYSYSFSFVIVPFLVTIFAFGMQLVLVLQVKSLPFNYDMYTMTLLCIAVCGITSALLGTGIITVISTLSTMVPIHEMMNPYQYGISTAGLAVSVINFGIALTKDPISYYTTYCSNSTLSRSSSLSPDGDGYESYPWHITTGHGDRYRSTVGRAILTTGTQNELLVMQVLTCQPYATIDYPVFCYFLIGILILLSCLSGFLYIQQYFIQMVPTPLQMHHTQEQESDFETSVATHDRVDTNPTATSPTMTTQMVPTISEFEDDLILYNRQQKTHEMNNLMPMTENAPIVVEASSSHVPETSSASYMDILRCVCGPTGSIFITFCITLGLFPSWTSGLRSVHECGERTSPYSLLSRYSNDLYIPLTFVLFNVGDLLGRIISTTTWFQMTTETATSTSSFVTKKLLFYACLRMVFFPLLLMCPTSIDPVGFGWTIESDMYSITVQMLFAMTNGYVIATSFVQAPNLILLLQHELDGQQHQERMSEILSCAVNFGLFSGSILSLWLMQLIPM